MHDVCTRIITHLCCKLTQSDVVDVSMQHFAMLGHAGQCKMQSNGMQGNVRARMHSDGLSRAVKSRLHFHYFVPPDHNDI